VKVLYASHTGILGGGERSLLELLAHLPEGVEAWLAAPPGRLADEARTLGLPVHPIPGTSGSFRLHPLHTRTAIVELLRSAFALARLGRHLGADLVHANSVRAGVAACLARLVGGPPAVVHVRDCLPSGAASSAIRWFVCHSAKLVIANSSHTADRFAVRPEGHIHVAYPGIDLRRFRSRSSARQDARAQIGLREDAVALGVIGQLTPWKGQDDAIRVVARLAGDFPSACLVLIGSVRFAHAATRYDNPAYEQFLRDLAEVLGVSDRVLFLGERDDVPEILPALDLLLVPSHEEPFGRVVVESLAAGVPVVATKVGGPSEIVRHGVDGMLLAPRDPSGWAGEIRNLLAQPGALAEMRARGRDRAEVFSAPAAARGVMDLYKAVSA
jgi:L-malate glycosyltransferase